MSGPAGDLDRRLAQRTLGRIRESPFKKYGWFWWLKRHQREAGAA